MPHKLLGRSHRWRYVALAAAVPLLCASMIPAQEKSSPGKFAIAIHGGAGRSADKTPPEEKQAIEASLGKALDLAVAVVKSGGTSLDAVEKVIRHLEDDPLFNAGKGAVFNAAGGHELDASIMDGKTLGAGGVAALRTVKNPISLARLVMEQTRHVLLTSDGAEKFADEMKVDRVENSWFDTEPRRKELDSAQAAEKRKQSLQSDPHAKSLLTTHHSPGADDHFGTVGCVVLDTHGNLAAGTSTGGRTNKKYGRVGDSPIVGAGTYASNATCGISGTGLGEQFIRHAVAYDISARMLYRNQSLSNAVHEVLTKTLNPDEGGLIAVGADGTIVMDFNTGGMARAAADWKGYREVKIGR